jgi:uncharacterized RDD family membrane protein YckC
VVSSEDPGTGAPRPRLTREDIGSWLSGPGSVIPTEQDWRGQRLGLPESGPGSIAGPGRRIAALLVDWVASLLLVRLFLPGLDYGSPASSIATLGFFFVEISLFTAVTGSSFGQRLLGMGVMRLDGGPPGPVRALLRSLLIVLLLPPLVWDRDSRGLHDRAAGTVLVLR